MDGEQKTHNGHRQRVRTQVLRSGFSSFAEHQFLEYVLFYCIPRKDTKNIAYSLLQAFGSLRGVCNASVEELQEITGMTANAALFVHTFPMMCSYYTGHCLIGSRIVSPAQVIPLLRLMSPLDKEIIFLVYLDEKNNYLSAEPVKWGKPGTIEVGMGEILSAALKAKAKRVIVAHNHPSGNPTPSMADFNATKDLQKTLWSMGVFMIDHLIIGSEKAFSFLLNKEV